MSTHSERRSSAPPPDGLRDLHRRLAVVLADLTFPVRRWQLVAAAELYGADAVTRAIIERAPEQRYQTLAEVVAVLGGVLGGRPVVPVPSPTIPRRRVVVPSARQPGVRRPVGSPRPAA